MATTNRERVAIAAVAVIMTFGTLGTYLFVIMQTSSSSSTTPPAASNQPALPIDPTAYKVSGPVTSLQVQDIKVGTGPAVQASDAVQVQYKGTIAQTGAKFDSSYDRGDPASFKLSSVIVGWQQGLVGMQVGGKRRLIIPASLAYGAQPPAGSGIPANADLVFEVELLKINP